MAKNLVIVESPAKAKTIKKFLGSNYEVMASNGHVRDLPKSQLGIDVEHGYEPKYITIRGKGELLAKLRKEVKKADKVYLATDPDREGEAISWHLQKALKLEDSKKSSRITFHEITKNAVKASIKQAREINMNLVDAQQARRMLDRMVGYGISPLLWAKVKRGLSAGRVQSAALKLICERENEINAFIPEEYWTIDADFDVKGLKKPLHARFYGTAKKKMLIRSRREMEAVKGEVEISPVSVVEVKKGERTRKPPFPFTTSTLQQEAAKVLNFSTQKTMRLAQQLYEGIDIKGHGTIGLITYLRTDSTRISDEADAACKAYIKENFGEIYVNKKEVIKTSGKKIQDAHEAIRPTYVDLSPVKVKESLARDQFRLYQLIWKRFVASRMESVVYETLSIRVAAGQYRFLASSSKVKFEGYHSVYVEEEKTENRMISGDINMDSVISLKQIEGRQHFTQPPAHFTEAALVKTMEELGIGRPSTYAPTITTIISRRYVAKENKNLYVTELGEVVNQIMETAFPTIVDMNFTANLESLLDAVEAGTVPWKTVVSNFYPDLAAAVEKAQEELGEVKIEDEVTDITCEQCGRNMVIKYGPHGKFLACPGFPECRNTKPYFEKTGIACPKCGMDIVVKKTKKGRRYYGCEGGPECDFMSWQKPSGRNCPVCGEALVEKGNRLVCLGETCGYTEPKPAETQNMEKIGEKRVAEAIHG